MQKARVTTPRYFHLYDASLLDSPRVRVLDSLGTVLSTINLAPSAGLANLYLSATAYTFTVSGEYRLVFEESDGVGGFDPIKTELLQVGMDPVSDIILSETVSQVFRLDDSVVGDEGSIITLKIIYQDDVEHEVGGDLTAPFDAGEDLYKVTITTPIENEGSYHLVWFDDGAFLQHVHVLGLIPRFFELTQIQVVDTSSGVTVPYTGTTVLVSKTDATVVKQTTTDGSGLTSFQLEPGDYIVSLTKAGVTFSKNNVAFTVIDTDKVVGNNNFAIDVEKFAANFSVVASSVSVCKMFATILDFEGKPLINREIVVELSQGPANFSGTGVFGTSKVYATNVDGYVEFELVQGIDVTITVMDHGWRRKVTVPALSTQNFMSLAATATDLLDVIKVVVNDAPRRS